jgi:hypothetical protein
LKRAGKVEKLLNNILPFEVAKQLKSKAVPEPGSINWLVFFLLISRVSRISAKPWNLKTW